jgi:vacuolar protein sorting-associated protein 13A/C
LRVSVERDLGASDAAPKTLRLFVPYWIKNNSSVPLSYRIVEVEPAENADAESVSRPDSLSRAAKSSKFSLRYSSKSLVRRGSISQRNSQILDVIEDCGTNYVMLSPQDYVNRSTNMRESRGNNFSPARVAICVAVGSCKQYSIGVSLFELENKVYSVILHIFIILSSKLNSLSTDLLILCNLSGAGACRCQSFHF